MTTRSKANANAQPKNPTMSHSMTTRSKANAKASYAELEHAKNAVTRHPMTTRSRATPKRLPFDTPELRRLIEARVSRRTPSAWAIVTATSCVEFHSAHGTLLGIEAAAKQSQLCPDARRHAVAVYVFVRARNRRG